MSERPREDPLPPLPHLTQKPRKSFTAWVIALPVLSANAAVLYLTVTGRIRPSKVMVLVLTTLLALLALYSLFARFWWAFRRPPGATVAGTPVAGEHE